uniref:Putative secreted protein n=1 Tax=Anopheles aquasalis TaxID=42839 RepID=T1DF38_ANOAQ
MKLAAAGIFAVVTILAGVSAMPRPSRADLQDKIREHLAAVPEDIRTELVAAFQEHRKPSAAFFESVRAHLLGLMENPQFRQFAERQYGQFLGLLTADLRDGVDGVVRNWLVNGGVPQADEELRQKFVDHFRQLKAVHFERFLAMLSPELREEIKAVAEQVQHGDARPHYNPELIERVREHFQQLKAVQAL